VFLDLRTLTERECRADLCIVGAGAAGLTIANELRESGLRIVILESGGLKREAEIDALNAGETDGLMPGRLLISRARGFGGTTQVWPGQSMRLAPEDFEHRAWVPHSGWPLSYETLAPYYDRAEASLGIPPRATSPDCSAFSPKPQLGRHLRRVLARANTVSVVLHATATRVGEREVVAASLEGKTLTVRARVVVLCAGGIENPRLLLLAGLGGRNVGRFFQDHAALWCAEVFADDPSLLQDEFELFYRRGVRYSRKLLLPRDVQRRDRLLAGLANIAFDYSDDAPVRAAARLARRALRRVPPSGSVRDMGLALRGAVQVGSLVRARVAGGRPRGTKPLSIRVLGVIEQAPDPDNRVELGSGCDAFGLRQPRVIWRIGELEHETFAAVTRHASVRLGGVADVRPFEWLATSAWREHTFDTFHHMGATRMSRAADEGVVDADLRLHHAPTLFVCGSSVFPTSGSANPTLTIVALAIRLADLLKGELAR
jgi:choline dehydrogenase-like flavoprotein